MARIPTRFSGPAQLAAAAATLYTVAAAEKIVLRHLHFYNADTVARKVTVSIGADAAATRLLDAYSIAPGTPYDFYCYQDADAAEIIQGFCDAATKVTLTMSGDRIVLG